DRGRRKRHIIPQPPHHAVGADDPPDLLRRQHVAPAVRLALAEEGGCASRLLDEPATRSCACKRVKDVDSTAMAIVSGSPERPRNLASAVTVARGWASMSS